MASQHSSSSLGGHKQKNQIKPSETISGCHTGAGHAEVLVAATGLSAASPPLLIDSYLNEQNSEWTLSLSCLLLPTPQKCTEDPTAVTDSLTANNLQ